MLIIEVTFEDEYEGKVVDFASYARRAGKKRDGFFYSWEDTIASLTGCNVIYLNDRRQAAS